MKKNYLLLGMALLLSHTANAQFTRTGCTTQTVSWQTNSEQWFTIKSSATINGAANPYYDVTTATTCSHNSSVANCPSFQACLPVNYNAYTTTAKIGIGITNPSESLEIAGNLKASGSVTSGSMKTGYLVVTGAITGSSLSVGTGNIDGGALTSSSLWTSGNLTLYGSIHFPDGSVLSSAYTPSSPGTFVNGQDITLIGRYTNGNDAGDIVFRNLNNGEMARIYSDPYGSGALRLNLNGVQKFVFNTDGTFYSRQNIVTQGNFPDYVFSPEYSLKPLAEVEQHIKAHHSLPGVPSAKTVAKEGLNTGEMLRLQMEKIEELTLHAIAQQKRIEELERMLKK